MSCSLGIRDIDTALRIYYSNIEIGNAEMKELFVGKTGKAPSGSTLNRLKNEALQLMAKRNIKQYRAYKVNTEIAYEAWGIDIKSLEYKHNKLKKLGLNET